MCTRFSKGGISVGKILIQKGLIVDGSGSSGFVGDLLIENGKISKIAPEIDQNLADKIIPAEGLVVIPGIIDGHSHTERTIFRNPYSESKLFQGVTSEVICQCGEGIYPLPEAQEKREDFAHLSQGVYSGSAIEGKPTWTTFATYKEALEEVGPAINLLPLIPHGALRATIVGWGNRLSTETEKEKMKQLAKQNMEEGAWGLSFGLEYPPSSYADLEELIALGKTIGEAGGYCAFHLRNEDNFLLEAIQEALDTGKESGCPVHISHLKADGKPNWGKAMEGLEMIRKAQKEGVQATTEQYPYEAFSTNLSLLFGGWVQEGGQGAYMDRLADIELREQLEQEIIANMNLRGGPEKIVISQTASQRTDCKGKTIADTAKEWDILPAQVVTRLLLEEKGGAWGVFFGMDIMEVREMLVQPDVMIISDGFGLSLPSDSTSFFHPRSFGSFTKVLGPMVREEKLLTLELAVHKMTGLTAKYLGISDRGILKEGLVADITIFDPTTVTDRATFDETGPYSEGINHVIVNGKIALEDGKINSERYGQILTRKINGIRLTGI